ncbi:hypothetical protein [Corynebacterium lipophiloflavum]|uniref:Uncharacterized protein n=1 Tax=Corynebacterium lipophiloflavum (strain ATCC 700352 / DSM 44291 / CCUG 37336 / JCM 10383 / DMMZ 1944) TaxID=525263 RepID=C0XU22_CORLD|nr:hypothetical protein [Corynebacterium lipophiloflavum]EEI16248.1 hypothetical protein HMPREF0298_1942 [Corynebacterium lipophiloflavum DSM 44291]
MGVVVDGTTPANPSGPVSWLDTLRSGGGDLGNSIGRGFTDTVDGIAAAIGGAFKQGDPFAKIGVAAQEFRDGQIALRDRQDLIDKLLNYGSCYNPSSPNRPANTWFKVNFTAGIGAIRGVEVLPGGGLKLLSAGLWDIRSQIVSTTASGLLERWITWEVRVLTPSGSVHSRQIGKIVGRSSGHSTIVSSVMVPDPYYTIEVWVYSQNYRGSVIGYGPAYSRLTAQQVNSSTAGNDGSEPSGLADDAEEGA